MLRRHLQQEVIAALLFAGLLLQSAQAVAPEWWAGQGVINTQHTADDYAAANVGQLKNLAQKAAAEMNSSLPGGAGAEIDTLIASWNAAPAAGVTRDDYAAVTLGQLKNVARPFYDRLSLGYPWWTDLAPNDFTAANVGQLKRAFAFAVPSQATLGSTDNDGDGFSDVLEFIAGTDPYHAGSKPGGVGDVGNGNSGSGQSSIALTLSAAGGDGQIVTGGSPIVLMVFASRKGMPWSGVSVSFQASTGLLSTSTAITDSSGYARVTYIAPTNTTGPQQIAATAESATTIFTVTVTPRITLMQQERVLLWNTWSSLTSPYGPDDAYGQLWGYDGNFEYRVEEYDSGEPRYQEWINGSQALAYGSLSDPDSPAWSLPANGEPLGGSECRTYVYEDMISGETESGGVASFGYKAVALIADHSVTSPVSRTFFRIRETTPLSEEGYPDWTQTTSAMHSVETLTITSGRRSNIIYLEPPVTEGLVIVDRLVSIDPERIEVRDGERLLTSLPLDKDPWSNENLQSQMPDSSIAWITGNTGFADTPEMPRLNAKIIGAPAGLQVQWRFECEYRRGNGYRKSYITKSGSLPEDTVVVPNKGALAYTDEMPASEVWNIYEHSRWVSELNESGFFGGLAKVFLKIEGGPPTEVCRFRIGGRNPAEDTAKEHIGQSAGQVDSRLWFAYAVAKEESHGYGGPGHVFYNQFFGSYRRPSDINPRTGRLVFSSGWDENMDWQCWANGWPAYNLDRDSFNGPQNGPGGYGLFQVTGSATDEDFIIPRRQIWNWQDNVEGGLAILEAKAGWVDLRYNPLQQTYSDSGAIPSYPQNSASPRRRLSGWDAYVCTAYNGLGMGGDSQIETVRIQGFKAHQRTCWMPLSNGWRFRHNQNRYCERIFTCIEENQ